MMEDSNCSRGSKKQEHNTENSSSSRRRGTKKRRRTNDHQHSALSASSSRTKNDHDVDDSSSSDTTGSRDDDEDYEEEDDHDNEEEDLDYDDDDDDDEEEGQEEADQQGPNKKKVTRKTKSKQPTGATAGRRRGRGRPPPPSSSSSSNMKKSSRKKRKKTTEEKLLESAQPKLPTIFLPSADDTKLRKRLVQAGRTFIAKANERRQVLYKEHPELKTKLDSSIPDYQAILDDDSDFDDDDDETKKYFDDNEKYELMNYVEMADAMGRAMNHTDDDREHPDRPLYHRASLADIDSAVGWAHHMTHDGDGRAYVSEEQARTHLLSASDMADAPLPPSSLDAVGAELEQHHQQQQQQNHQYSTATTPSPWSELNTSGRVAFGIALEEMITNALLPLAQLHVQRCRRLLLPDKDGGDDDDRTTGRQRQRQRQQQFFDEITLPPHEAVNELLHNADLQQAVPASLFPNLSQLLVRLVAAEEVSVPTTTTTTTAATDEEQGSSSSPEPIIKAPPRLSLANNISPASATSSKRPKPRSAIGAFNANDPIDIDDHDHDHDDDESVVDMNSAMI